MVVSTRRERGAVSSEASLTEGRLRRLGLWAGGAVLSLGAAVLAGYGDGGSARLGVAATQPRHAPDVPAAAPGARRSAVAFDAEIETRRLDEAVRALASDHDRLLARVNALQHNLADVTGSLPSTVASASPRTGSGSPSGPSSSASNAVAAAVAGAQTNFTPEGDDGIATNAFTVSYPPVPTPGEGQRDGRRGKPGAFEPPPIPPSTRADGTSLPEQTAIPQPRPSTTPSRLSVDPTEPPQTLPRPLQSSVQPVTQSPPVHPPQHPIPASAQVPAQGASRLQTGRLADAIVITPDAASAQSTATKTDFGVDLGGASSLEGVRALWTTIKGKHEKLLENLRPVFSVREGSKPGSIDFRLVAGPFADAGGAARLCVALAAAGLNCRTAVFDGQRLAQSRPTNGSSGDHQAVAAP